jgi:uracil-DNA glycosylase
VLLSTPNNKALMPLTMTELDETIRKCRKCRLWQNATQTVPGEGPVDAKIMLLGQNPGADEDRTGRPFVGRAGKFLNKTLAANGINREEVFITNIVKHTSPQNRKPFEDEIDACVAYLTAQIRTIKPQIVVLMGATAWQAPRIEGIQYFETVHPSAAMRFTKMRKRFEADFASLKERL